jgi:hypothetical protein
MLMLNPCLKRRRGPGTTIATIARAALEAWPEEVYRGAHALLYFKIRNEAPNLQWYTPWCSTSCVLIFPLSVYKRNELRFSFEGGVV